MSDAKDILPPDDSWSPQPEQRRGFMTRVAAVVVGGIVGVPAALGGLFTVLDPIKPGRKKEGGLVVPVTQLDALPADGKPRLFVIRADLVDGWTKTPDARIGAVFLSRTGDEVKCLSVICPHAGCFVGQATDGSFKCPCHDSEFEKDGKVRPTNAQGKDTVSPRDLDSLEVEVKNEQVFVHYKRFRAGVAEKIAAG